MVRRKAGGRMKSKADDCVHTLIAVFTDEGITGWGSVFTNDELVRGALHVLAPLVHRRKSFGASTRE